MLRKLLCLGISLLALTGCISNHDSEIMNDSDAAYTQASPYSLPGDKVYPQIPITRDATGYKVVVIDPNIPAWAAYDEDGNLVKEGSASAGSDYCSDEQAPCRTPAGTFKVYSKGDASCHSSEFPLKTHGGASMPYCMHFNRGIAMHGSDEMAPYDASHGCVRMVISSAKWLNQNFVNVGTTVIVLPYNKPDAYENTQ
jgi:lipoprotein-anchoring transpeptidase ErfK/SrfK